MKRFLLRSLIFTVFVVLLVGGLFILSNRLISKGENFSIPSDRHSLIMGHSQPACTFEDSLISGFYNVAQNTEGYPYSYFKARKLLQHNSHIKNIFIEFANNQISPYAIERVYGQYLDINMPRNLPVTDTRFAVKAFYHNRKPGKIVNALKNSFRSNLEFLFDNKGSYVSTVWKKHNTPANIYQRKADDEKNYINLKNQYGSFQDFYSISKDNLEYLKRLELLCKEYGVKLYFVRSPLPFKKDTYNEFIFQSILQRNFSEVQLLDFRDFPVGDELFADSQHLNKRGQYEFSLFFDNLIKSGLLESENIQAEIDRAMQEFSDNFEKGK